MPTYRTQKHLTDRILGDWILKERLAFNLEPCLTVAELQKALPERCKQQLGELKPTDNTFRKLSSGFNKVSDVWIELMRFVGVQDFSPEQAIFGTVSTFLDSENVRVKLNASYDAPHRKNSIEVFCLKEPSYQGLIRYEGDRLSFPLSIFEAVINRRLDVYSLYCENLSDLLLIPGVSDPQSLLIAENNARLAEEHRGVDRQPELDEFNIIDELDESDEDSGVSAEDAWMDLSDTELAELEAAQDDEAARDAYLEKMADIRDCDQFMGSLMDEEISDDAIALTPYDEAEDETDPDVQDQMLREAIQDSINGHGNSIDDEANDSETTPFDGAVNPEVHHMIPFDERATIDAARLAEEHHRLEEEARLDKIDGFLGVSDETDSSDADADAEIETAVDGHGFESDEVDGKIEDFDGNSIIN